MSEDKAFANYVKALKRDVDSGKVSVAGARESLKRAVKKERTYKEKRAPTAYNLFVKSEMKKLPGNMSQPEKMSRIGRAWRSKKGSKKSPTKKRSTKNSKKAAYSDSE